MLRNDTIQAGLIAELKSISAVTSLVTGSFGVEIRENQYEGTQFLYPNIRLDIINQVPSIEGCAYGVIDFIVRVYSEDASSQECDNIAGLVFQNLKRSFTRNGIFFSGVYCTSLGSAHRINLQTWEANVQYKGMAEG